MIHDHLSEAQANFIGSVVSWTVTGVEKMVNGIGIDLPNYRVRFLKPFPDEGDGISGSHTIDEDAEATGGYVHRIGLHFDPGDADPRDWLLGLDTHDDAALHHTAETDPALWYFTDAEIGLPRVFRRIDFLRMQLLHEMAHAILVHRGHFNVEQEHDVEWAALFRTLLVSTNTTRDQIEADAAFRGIVQ